MVIVFRTYDCTSFLSSFNNESVMFVNREKKSYRISCRPYYNLQMYVMNNLVNPRAWWQCSIKITVLFVGRCLPGKFHQVDSASAAGSLRRVTFMSCAQNVRIICFSVRTYFRSFNAETCLLEVALNRILYRRECEIDLINFIFMLQVEA